MIKADYYQNEWNLNASFLSPENRVGEHGCMLCVIGIYCQIRAHGKFET